MTEALATAADAAALTARTEGFQALSFTFSIRTSHGSMARRLDHLLDSLPVAARPAHTYAIVHLDRSEMPYRILFDTEEIAAVPSSAKAIDYLLWHVNRQVIERTGDLVLIHAGAVAGRGGGIVLPAPSGSGKSTIVAGLIRSGMSYLTDEAAAIDPTTGALHPYPKPLSLDQGSLRALADLDPPFDDAVVPPGSDESHVPAVRLRADSLASTCSPAFVIAPCFSPGATNRIVPVSRAQALVLLVESSFNLASFGPSAFLALAQVVRQSACYRLEFSDLARACALVAELVERAPQPQPQPQPKEQAQP